MNQESYEQIRKRVSKKKAFYKNFFRWLFICSALMIFNANNFHGHWWFIYPTIGWGIGVFFQGMEVFSSLGFGPDWEKKELEKELTRMQMKREQKGLAPPPSQDMEVLNLEDWLIKEKEKNWKDEDLV